jgi:oligosaccharyltransferase complex subunit delta (ribophorin II)
MQWWQTILQLSLLASTAVPAAAASWGFADATVSVQTKGAGVGAGVKEEYGRRYH